MAVRIGALPDSSMVATRVGTRAPGRLRAARPILPAHGTPQDAGRSGRTGCVTFDALTSASRMAFPGRHGQAEASCRSRPRLSVNTAEAAVDAAVAGRRRDARAVLPGGAARWRDGRLQIVLAAFEPEPSPVNLVHAARASLPLKMRAFLDFAAPRLRHTLAAMATAR